jgi:TorA maturation chaperone TorD
MLREYVKDHASMAAVADGRATVYGVLVEVFGSIPEGELLTKVMGSGLGDMLDTWYELGDQRFQAGVDHVRSYQSKRGRVSEGELLTDLSVDRTRILRAPGNSGVRLPYEGLYTNEENPGSSALELRSFYRKAGLLPGEEVRESPDFLCIELDFMRNLCRRERDQWSSSVDVGETIATEGAFLTEHLGSWVGEFCCEAETHASTEFYKGFLHILGAFIDMDKEYIQDLAELPY